MRYRLIAVAIAFAMHGPAALAQNALATPPASDGGSGASGTVADAEIMPTDYRLNLLIRTTIIALNQANQTGNYTVLRDLGAPDFQTANTAAKLSEAFSALRASGFDLSPILFFEPKLVKKPEIRDNGLLRLSGFFATQPQQVNFDLAFQKARAEWRLYGIALTTTPAGAAVDEQAKPTATKPSPDTEAVQKR